jgi:ribulose-bisphosphate carboxylase small chain
MSFIVNRPTNEPGFYLERQEAEGRRISYTIKSYSVKLIQKVDATNFLR